METCNICLERLCDGDGLVGFAVPCGHGFHRDCFASWNATGRSRDPRRDDHRPDRGNAISVNCRCPTCNCRVSEFLNAYLTLNSDERGTRDGDGADDESDDDDESDANNAADDEDAKIRVRALRRTLKDVQRRLRETEERRRELDEKLERAQTDAAATSTKVEERDAQVLEWRRRHARCDLEGRESRLEAIKRQREAEGLQKELFDLKSTFESYKRTTRQRLEQNEEVEEVRELHKRYRDLTKRNERLGRELEKARRDAERARVPQLSRSNDDDVGRRTTTSALKRHSDLAKDLNKLAKQNLVKQQQQQQQQAEEEEAQRRRRVRADEMESSSSSSSAASRKRRAEAEDFLADLKKSSSAPKPSILRTKKRKNRPPSLGSSSATPSAHPSVVRPSDGMRRGVVALRTTTIESFLVRPRPGNAFGSGTRRHTGRTPF